jgi:hypothetical protein
VRRHERVRRHAPRGSPFFWPAVASAGTIDSMPYVSPPLGATRESKPGLNLGLLIALVLCIEVWALVAVAVLELR